MKIIIENVLEKINSSQNLQKLLAYSCKLKGQFLQILGRIDFFKYVLNDNFHSPKTTIFLGLRGLFLMPNLDISMDLYNTLIVSCAYGLNKSRARSILRLNQKLRTLWRRKQDIETPKILYFFNDMSNQKSFRSISKTHSFKGPFIKDVIIFFRFLTPLPPLPSLLLNKLIK